ncbi:hypothetical protein [Ectobacillus panaciterrae]|uniref:hypothetical protein n=1 Tax=Ectobacillus panaciterrae TaxID=363872 RepID=UPI00041870D1|nr:hypothetical protein [Ectobacillus panaciterrae]
MKILSYILVGLLVILLLKFVIGLAGAAFKFIIYLLLAGLVVFIILSLVNR